MPRDGSGVYSLPNAPFVADSTIASATMNAQLADMAEDANGARPISAGGTGATNAADALTALGALNSSDLQTAIADTTAGRILTVGAFGWGAAAGAGTPSMLIQSNDYNQAIVAGVYSGAGSLAVNGPPNSTNFGPMLVLRRLNTVIVQIAVFGGSASAVSLATRASADAGATWSGWAEIYTSSTGIPGSALLDTPANNAVGSYAMAQCTGTPGFGSSVAGSSLKPSSASGTSSATALTGTWTSMCSFSTSGLVGIFKRAA